jgi:heme exporter protein A
MRAAAALERFGMAHAIGFPVNVLSTGQRRRVALARVLGADRPLWLLDEPTSALDAVAQARLAEIMRAHLAGGGLIVVATHAPLGLDARELKLGAMESADP